MSKRKHIIITVIFLAAMFFVGKMVKELVEESRLAEESLHASEEDMTTSSHMLEAQNWGLGFGESGTRPTGTASQEEMAEYDAYFIAPSTEEMKLYLTFDCGYENGNTEAILDALKKHGVSATFFVVGHYLESAPEMVCRMVEEGHNV